MASNILLQKNTCRQPKFQSCFLRPKAYIRGVTQEPGIRGLSEKKARLGIQMEYDLAEAEKHAGKIRVERITAEQQGP